MKRFLAILIFVLSITHLVEGQTLPFRTYSIERGLSESVVNTMMQDEDGYLWAGTSYGLNRFDGINFKNYYSEDGLLNNQINSLYEDDNNQLWIGTAEGVNVMREDSIHTLPELKPLQSSTILSIYQDSLGEYWFATDGEGIWNLDKNNELTQYQEIHGLGDDRVRDIVESKDVLWFATRDGLTKLEDGNLRTFTTRHGLPDNRLRDLVLNDDGTLWVASRGGLCRFVEQEFTCYTEEDGLVNNRIQSISIAKSGNLWLGTEEGASYFSNGQFTNYTAEEGLANDFIYATEYDHEGNIWFGTFGGGINIFLGNQFKNYTIEHGLPTNVVTSVTQAQDGSHWIGTYGGGITNISEGDLVTYDDQKGLVDNKVYAIKAISDNRLLIGTRWGLSIFDGKKFQNYDESDIPFRKIRSILEPQKSAGIWFGTYGEGITHYHNGEFRQLTEEEGLANNTVLGLEEAPDGSIWIATYGGVSRLQDSSFTNYRVGDGLPNNGVLDILIDDSGDLWFATFGGIARFTEDSFEAITAEDGLPDEVCYFIEQDDQGIYWIGTNKGVIRLDYEAYRSESESQVAPAIKLITQDQGLVANEMNTGASFKDQQGNLWFGSVGGVTQFDPSLEKIHITSPTVHIENIRVSGRSIPMNPALEISSDNQNITFEFIGISFSAPEQVQYEYRLRNFDEQWQKTPERSVRYSALMPGDYTFEVKAQDTNGHWSAETAQISFTVLAPFWMQWWFIALVVLALIGIIAFIYNYYRIKKMVDIERMRVRIASDLHDDVGSALTEIALQSDFLQTMDVDPKLEESLQQIGTQSRKIVTSLDDIVWSIDARNDTMGDLTDRMQDYVNSVITNKEVYYHFEGDMQEKLDVALKENLYLIFKEAINNVAKHSNAEKVDITLQTNADDFLMSIKDNGTGASEKRKSGQGLRNMKMRAKRIDADITFKNSNGFEVRVKNDK